MIATALVAVIAWILFLAVVVAFFMGSHQAQTPRVPLTREQQVWFKAAAKVAHRRHA